MKINLLTLQEGRTLPLWTTKENKTYEANFTHIRILNPDQLNALQTLPDNTITVIGPGMRFSLRTGHIRFGTDKLIV